MDPHRLTEADLAAVNALVAAVTAADGVRPLNDDALHGLRRDTERHRLLRDAAGLAGYAQLSPAFGTAQICVRPDARGRGLGRRLLDDVLAAGATGVWAFGDLPAARALAAAAGLRAVRGLLIMERPLDAVARPPAPAGVRLRTFTEADADALLAVNAAAFADHPEQGSFSLADLRARQAEPWWEPAGLILAEDAAGVVGFHWTKRHDAATGEVYVIGVHPRAHGRGLGTVLLEAGLAHLAAVGCRRVILYVEADNPAVRLYERTGFRVAHTDVLYGR
nr:mycothiol synthase [Propionibacterium sp.]